MGRIGGFRFRVLGFKVSVQGLWVEVMDEAKTMITTFDYGACLGIQTSCVCGQRRNVFAESLRCVVSAYSSGPVAQTACLTEGQTLL